MQADRRRLNAPPGGTSPVVFAHIPSGSDNADEHIKRPLRLRKADEHRKIFLRTGVVPSASGSAYYEISPQTYEGNNLLVSATSSLKITCTVHGPRPLPRNAAFSPNLLLSTHVKFAPFATRERRGYVRDSTERDLGVHLETALRGAIIGERWPKSAVEVIITVLEGEEDEWWGAAGYGKEKAEGGWGLMSVLAGCITVAGAALVDAGIDCVDLISGGIAATTREGGKIQPIVIDPSPPEHEITAACVVAYLQSRDEVTEIWMKGDAGTQSNALLDEAVKAASLTRTVLVEAIKEVVQLKQQKSEATANGEKQNQGSIKEVEMAG